MAIEEKPCVHGFAESEEQPEKRASPEKKQEHPALPRKELDYLNEQKSSSGISLAKTPFKTQHQHLTAPQKVVPDVGVVPQDDFHAHNNKLDEIMSRNRTKRWEEKQKSAELKAATPGKTSNVLGNILAGQSSLITPKPNETQQLSLIHI